MCQVNRIVFKPRAIFDGNRHSSIKLYAKFDRNLWTVFIITRNKWAFPYTVCLSLKRFVFIADYFNWDTWHCDWKDVTVVLGLALWHCDWKDVTVVLGLALWHCDWKYVTVVLGLAFGMQLLTDFQNSFKIFNSAVKLQKDPLSQYSDLEQSTNTVV